MRITKLILILMAILLFLGDLATAQENTSKNKKKEDVVIQIFKDAKNAVFQKDWQKAIKEFQEILSISPESNLTDDTFYWLSYSLNRSSRTMDSPDRVLSTQKHALQLLEDLMKQFPDSNWLDDARLLRVEIAEELVKKGFKEYKKYIINDAHKSGETDAELKLVALDALLQMDKEKAFPLLEKIIRTNANPELKEKALFVLSQTSDPRVIPLLAEVALNDTNRKAREKAIFWLGQIQEPESLNQLINIYNKTSEIKIKEKVIFSLSQHQDTKAVNLLMEIAGNEKEDINFREKAIFWLGQYQAKKPELLKSLDKLYSSTNKTELREKIIFTISQFENNLGVTYLINLYRNESNIKLKKRIIFWLGQSGSKEAQEFIEKIILE